MAPSVARCLAATIKPTAKLQRQMTLKGSWRASLLIDLNVYNERRMKSSATSCTANAT
jgi:hypothetical protein